MVTFSALFIKVGTFIKSHELIIIKDLYNFHNLILLDTEVGIPSCLTQTRVYSKGFKCTWHITNEVANKFCSLSKWVLQVT